MKKGLTTIVAVFLSLLSFAQGTSLLIGSRHDVYNQPSSSWYFSDSVRYLYDGSVHDTAALNYDYSQSTWKLRFKVIKDFDNTGVFLDQYYGIVDTLTGQISGYAYKAIYGYNAAGDTTSLLTQQWDTTTNNWLNYYRIYRYPDANHHDTAVILQTYTSGSWKNAQYGQIQYNAAGYRINYTLYGWASNAWQETKKSRYNYDAANNLIAEVQQTWDLPNTAWLNSKKFAYTWNSSGDNTQRQHQLWNTGTSSWDNDSMVYQSFSATHKVLNQTSQWYDNNIVAYNNSRQSNYTYDAADNLTVEENDTWYNSQWKHSSKYTNQYDALRNRTFRQLDYYDNSILMYSPNERNYFYYTLINTGVYELNTSGTAALYPNPVNGRVAHVAFDNVNGTDVNVSIYDLSGRIISTENRAVAPGFNDLALDISYLSTGQYLVSVKDANGAQYFTVKMIKQ